MEPEVQGGVSLVVDCYIDNEGAYYCIVLSVQTVIILFFDVSYSSLCNNVVQCILSDVKEGFLGGEGSGLPYTQIIVLQEVFYSFNLLCVFSYISYRNFSDYF